MRFCDKLIELRKKMGLSQEELGYKVDVARQTISKWENGETTPELDKLIELSKLFEISIDELVGNSFNLYKKIDKKRYFEYVSKTKIGKLPLVHINIGYELGNMRTAKGVLAIGNISKGIISFGGFSIGLLSFGGVSIGLISLGCIAIALLLSIGGISIGSLAIGGLALGIMAIGGFAIGIYSIGGFALAKNIAYGGYAVGHIAICEATSGAASGVIEIAHGSISKVQLEKIILKEFPKTWKIIVKIFSSL